MVPRGNRYATLMRVTRSEFAGEVSIAAPNLPEGIKMTAPEKHEWTTYWDPKGVALSGEGPSHVHSIYWANAEEKESLRDKN